MEQKLVNIYEGMTIGGLQVALLLEMKELNAEGWRVDQIVVTRFSMDDSSYRATHATLLCSKL